ncbi:hypothetical protein CbuG_1483 [Coxiella burnetii CbuG_Q212]|nr:hypothetical protein CbuG_1483 [Coxiella burnetii CbuG_Q212]
MATQTFGIWHNILTSLPNVLPNAMQFFQQVFYYP